MLIRGKADHPLDSGFFRSGGTATSTPIRLRIEERISPGRAGRIDGNQSTLSELEYHTGAAGILPLSVELHAPRNHDEGRLSKLEISGIQCAHEGRCVCRAGALQRVHQ